MAQNMYRVGDYVYFETMPSAPYQIRRIEELNKTPTGAVEAKVTSFFRRRDLPNSLLKIADQAERQSQILSKPRKILLATNKESCTVINTSSAITNTNGEAETAPKENGIPAEPNIKSRNNSVEPHEDANKADEDKDTANDDDHKPKCYGFAGLPSGAEKLDTEELHELRQRELFLSRIVELLPATGIRGKCMVAILNDVETCDMYLGQEDSFFYSLVYDPANQTLLADKGRIEIGIRHQADIPEIIDQKETQNDEEKADQIEEKMEIEQPQEEGKEANIAKEEKEEEQPATSTSEQNIPKGNELTPNKKLLESGGVQLTDRERCVYHPNHQLQDLEIDQFLLVARAIGTFSRALDTSSSTKLPTLHQTAAAASRDITLLHAMALMHQANYDFGKATKFLVPPADTQHYPLEADKVTSHNTSNLGGPILCRDQLEEFSASESTLFEDGIEKYGKDFNDIRLDYLPWKSMRDIVEYYYMWKTTSRYADLQKAKRAEKDNKLKQVYIPNYNKPNSNLVSSKSSGMQCESCHLSEAPFWYAWGPSQEFRLCDKCWMVWKKRGGLKNPHELETFDLDGANDGRGGNSGNRRNGLPIANPDRQTAGQILIGQKGRVAFFLNSPLETRIARRLAPRQVFNVRKAARAPFQEFDLKGIQDYYFSRPIGDVLNTARQVTKRGSLSPWSMDHLTKMHKKRGQPKPLAAVAEQNGGGKKIG